MMNFVKTLCIDELLLVSSQTDRLDMDVLSSTVLAADAIAYIIFTSGSTGIPKAVVFLFR